MDQKSNSYLPEPVLHKILRLLPAKDAIRASATSKLWRSAWSSSPVFEFDETSLPFKGAEFFDYADRSLALWSNRCNDNRVNMERVSICVDIYDDQFYRRFVQLVAIATSRNVKVLELKSCSEYFKTIFGSDSFWGLLSACKSLDDLSLSDFYLIFVNSSPVISSLRKLNLSCINIDDISIKNFLSSFPLLEDLVMSCCLGFRELRVLCPKLKTMEFVCFDSVPKVVINDAVNLQSFSYKNCFKSCNISFLNCKLLTSLQIELTRFSNATAIEDFISQIPHLENLNLQSCRMPERIKISHSNLKSLNINGCKGLSKAEINTPNLCVFKYWGAFLHFSSFRYSSGLLNAKLMLGTACLDWFWFITLRNFLESFSNCKELTVDSYIEGFAEELRDNNLLPDPFYELTHLNITNRKLSIADYASFVNTMMELFPCVETLLLKTSYARISIEYDEDGSRTLNWQDTIYTSDGDEYDRIFQSINVAIDEIAELLGWTEEDCSHGGKAVATAGRRKKKKRRRGKGVKGKKPQEIGDLVMEQIVEEVTAGVSQKKRQRRRWKRKVLTEGGGSAEMLVGQRGRKKVKLEA